MEIFKVETMATETVRPSCLTPDHPRTLDFSIFDVFSPPIYTGGIFFYNPQVIGKEREISERLKKSLSETLTDFYPLAGTVTGASIDCNDEGAVYQEARVSCCLSGYLKNPNLEAMKGFIPGNAESREAASWPLLQVQVNFFACGGLAIAIRVSHKICDGDSFVMFVQGWAAAALGTNDLRAPEFKASKIFPPPPELHRKLPDRKADFNVQASITKRFLFNASNVAELKTKASSASRVKDPTRVEAVTALIWKCFNKASRLVNSGRAKPSVLHQPVSLRRRMGRSIPQNWFGNLVFAFMLKAEEDIQLTLGDLVDNLRQEKEIFNRTARRALDGDGASSFILQVADDLGVLASRGDSIHFLVCSSWCKMPLYEADFGWGKPIWVTGPGPSMFKNVVLLMDSKGGEGIEAWVTLSEEAMAALEQDQELLHYASPNPGISV